MEMLDSKVPPLLQAPLPEGGPQGQQLPLYFLSSSSLHSPSGARRTMRRTVTMG